MNKRITISIITILIIIVIIIWYTFTTKNKTIRYYSNENNEQQEKESYMVEDVYINNGDNKIYGMLYRPNTEEKAPIIIYSHGLGGNYSYGIDYAEELVKKGYAIYLFDFCGGSATSKSTGETTEMSVLTEMSDLEAVLKEIKTWDFVDKIKITLFGTSQGGLVSSQVAASHEQEIHGLILFYPAFVISDDIHSKYPTKEDIPEKENYMGWIEVSSKYMLDIYDMDFYKEVENYKKEVLIIHGDQDSIVDLKYSKQLNDIYQNSELKIIEDAGHGFYGNSFQESLNYILEYLEKIES